MIIGTPNEKINNETRTALTPNSAKELIKLGYSCIIEKDSGLLSGFLNKHYTDVGVQVVNSSKELWDKSDIIIKVREPTRKELKFLTQEKTLISFFWPSLNEDLLVLASKTKANLISMDMVPRISRAQKLDALSSMANIAGYRAVIEACNNFERFLTGQITAAGKIPPAKILIIGAGVAGLAAIGTAQSLGAVVRAFDVRPEVAEQIESMGAEFLMLDFEEDTTGESGYAKPASKNFIKKEMELFKKQAEEIDIVITTALIPGKPAPKLWLKEMVKIMKPGSVIVDLAAEQGGNCDLTVPGKIITTTNSVKIIGYTDFPGRMASQSSSLYASNIRHLIDDLTPNKNGKINLNMKDDVIRNVTIINNGKITWPPPPLKIPAIGKVEKNVPNENNEKLLEKNKKAGLLQILILAIGAILMFVLGNYAPASFMQHLTVFVLACFVGYQVIWNVSHALHTPLMAVTNAISGIIIIGALLQINSTNNIVTILSSISVLIAMINIVGGFLVTKKMLDMFRRS